ncbi:hypothetical protein BGZ57DRAFT_915797 [Hyaloscypha finlandica]|nr:hypothetical protein BGZ57DRAFT_915797 [Hyaloscypha finlandica]
MNSDQDDTYELHVLCDRCHAVFDQSTLVQDLAGPAEHYTLHSRYEDLRTKAEGRCHFCSLVYFGLRGKDETIEKKYPGGIQLTIKESASTWMGAILDIECSVTVEDLNEQEYALSFRVNNSPVARGGEHRSHLALSQASTSSSAHVGLARLWIDRCRNSDALCGRTDPNFIPSRLIHISGAADTLKVYLHVTKPHDQGLQYCCLSHCWGGLDVLSLKSTNFQQLKESIPL